MINKRKLYVFVSVTIFVTAFIFIFTFRQDAQVVQREVKSKSLSPTTSFAIIETNQNSCLIEIKNNSNKEISAYQIGFNNGQKILVDRAISGIYIKPNDIFRDIISLEDSRKNIELILETVMFSDNSHNGDNNVANNVRERRFAIKNQLERLLPLLQDIKPNISSPGVLVAIQAKKKDLEDNSIKPTNSPTKKAYNQGLIDSKRSVDSVLEDLEENLSHKSNVNPSVLYSSKINQLNNWLIRLQN